MLQGQFTQSIYWFISVEINSEIEKLAENRSNAEETDPSVGHLIYGDLDQFQ